MSSGKILWWGYRHINGHIQVKRFFNQFEIDDAYESPFAIHVYEPFEAENRADAINKIKQQS